MAKRRSNTASPTSNTPTTAPARLPFELRQDAGDYAGARRLAGTALSDAASGDDVKARAQKVLDEVKLDGQQFMLFGGLLILLAIVFSVFILKRNGELPTTPGGPIPSKDILVPPPETVPAQRPGDTNGTP